jgi:hypothetical protein
MSTATRIDAGQGASTTVEATGARGFSVEAISRAYVTAPRARPACDNVRADEISTGVRLRWPAGDRLLSYAGPS